MRALLGTVALFLLGCGREGLDLLVRVEDPSCAAAESEEQCASRAKQGCVYQPNDVGCASDDLTCAPGVCRDGKDAFVRVDGGSFSLGGEPFRFVGVSSWALLPTPDCAEVPPAVRETWIANAYQDLVASGTKVARLRAFQKAAGPMGTDFSLIDSSVRAARRAGVRLQLVLDHGNHTQLGCLNVSPRDDAWYGGGYTKAEGDYALSFADYALAVVTKYKDEPTVLGYTLLESMGDADPQKPDPEVLTTFVSTVGELLRGVATRQLVSLDLVWDNTPSYAKLQQLPIVDFVDVDDYTTDGPLRPELLTALQAIGKPAVVGEGAFELLGGDDAEAFNDRADRARGRMKQWKDAGFAGALFWGYQPGWEVPSEEFDLRDLDPMLQPKGVVADAPW